MNELHEMYMGRPIAVMCKATTTVDFGKFFDNGKVAVLKCCYWKHDEGTHFNPRLLLTLGGTTVKRKGWSAYTE